MSFDVAGFLGAENVEVNLYHVDVKGMLDAAMDHIRESASPELGPPAPPSVVLGGAVK
jgi:hypothetical protein